jgi:acyl-CoA thioester hydrolase
MAEPGETGAPSFIDVASVDVQWGDVDRMRHVNNVVYFRWLETARTNYFERLGFAKHVPPHVYPILVSIRCDYRAQLRDPDTVQVGYATLRLGRTSVTHAYRVWSTALHKVAAEGEGTWICFDYAGQKPLPLPDGLVKAMEAMEGRSFPRAP